MSGTHDALSEAARSNAARARSAAEQSHAQLRLAQAEKSAAAAVSAYNRSVREAERRARDVVRPAPSVMDAIKPGQRASRRVSQADVPNHTLLEAVEVANAVHQTAGLQGRVEPVRLASHMNRAVSSNVFRSRTAASAAYGLTDAGAQADDIGLTDLGRRLLVPANSTEAHHAIIAALRTPRLLNDLLESYVDREWPPNAIVRQHLERAGYPAHSSEAAAEVIRTNLQELGLIDSSMGRLVLRLRQPSPPEAIAAAPAEQPSRAFAIDRHGEDASARAGDHPSRVMEGHPRVFISVGSDDLRDDLAELLAFGGYIPIESPVGQSPTSAEVISKMRNCQAAVVLLHPAAGGRGEPSDDSLVAIGAAVALCGTAALFLCPPGVTMPKAHAHLRHIYYSGDSLDREATVAIMRTFSGIGGHR